MNEPVLPGIRILVIDDSKELLEVLKIILEKQGYDANTSTSPVGLDAFVSEQKIDLLIIDVILNGANGRQICKDLKSNGRTNYFPIMLMSASPEYLVDPEECFGDDTIEKPFDINVLVKKISALLPG